MSRHQLAPPSGKIEPQPCFPVGFARAGDADGARMEVYPSNPVTWHTWSFCDPKLKLPGYGVARG